MRNGCDKPAIIRKMWFIYYTGEMYVKHPVLRKIRCSAICNMSQSQSWSWTQFERSDPFVFSLNILASPSRSLVGKFLNKFLPLNPKTGESLSKGAFKLMIMCFCRMNSTEISLTSNKRVIGSEHSFSDESTNGRWNYS